LPQNEFETIDHHHVCVAEHYTVTRREASTLHAAFILDTVGAQVGVKESTLSAKSERTRLLSHVHGVTVSYSIGRSLGQSQDRNTPTKDYILLLFREKKNVNWGTSSKKRSSQVKKHSLLLSIMRRCLFPSKNNVGSEI
jgi:hypothetical protein